MIIKERFERVEPFLSPRSEQFWRAGAGGVLQIARCQNCGRYRHPPRPVCDACRADDLRFEDVSGHGTLWSWTVNRYAWQPTMPPPYVVALVELVEQPGLRLLSNLVNCELADIHIGMDVRVCFAAAGDAFVPLFMPLNPAGGALNAGAGGLNAEVRDVNADATGRNVNTGDMKADAAP